jgi:hypothetical protein
MEKKLVVAYTILGIAASVFLAGWLVFHAYRTREANIAQASSRMKEIGTIVASASMSKDFLSSPVFKEKVEAIFKNDHHLDLIAIYDQQEILSTSSRGTGQGSVRAFFIREIRKKARPFPSIRSSKP